MFDEYHDPDAWLLVFAGATAGNGMGDDISAEEAARWSAAFAEPLTYENVRRAGLYDDAGFCAECRVPYCDRHMGREHRWLRTVSAGPRAQPRPPLEPRRLRLTDFL